MDDAFGANNTRLHLLWERTYALLPHLLSSAFADVAAFCDTCVAFCTACAEMSMSRTANGRRSCTASPQVTRPGALGVANADNFTTAWSLCYVLALQARAHVLAPGLAQPIGPDPQEYQQTEDFPDGGRLTIDQSNAPLGPRPPLEPDSASTSDAERMERGLASAGSNPALS